MKFRIIPLAVLFALGTSSAFAAQLNLRHEYAPDRDGDEHRDRIAISHRFENQIGFSVEAKWGSKEGGSFLENDDVVSKGHEVGVSYNYKVNDKFSLQPAFQIDSNSSSSTYKFNLRGGYQVTKEWDVAARYRYGYKNTDNSHYNQVNLYSNYKFDWGKLGVDLEYKDLQGDTGGWKDKGTDHLFSFVGEYTKLQSGWVPFGEIAFITYDKDKDGYKDDYIPRYRVGLKYNF